MNNFHRIFLASALTLIAFTSCTKQLDLVPQPCTTTPSAAATTLAETTTSDDFDWSTTKKVTFTFHGHAAEEYTLVLKVLDADGNILFQKMQKSNDTYQTTLRIATNQSTININYGAYSKTIECSAGTSIVNLD